jgi:hypothetical protein
LTACWPQDPSNSPIRHTSRPRLLRRRRVRLRDRAAERLAPRPSRRDRPPNGCNRARQRWRERATLGDQMKDRRRGVRLTGTGFAWLLRDTSVSLRCHPTGLILLRPRGSRRSGIQQAHCSVARKSSSGASIGDVAPLPGGAGTRGGREPALATRRKSFSKRSPWLLPLRKRQPRLAESGACWAPDDRRGEPTIDVACFGVDGNGPRQLSQPAEGAVNSLALSAH